MSQAPPISAHDLIWEVQQEHLSEAEFLFEVREAVLEAPHYTLAELEAGPERRWLAHLDALLIGGRIVADELLMTTIEDADEVEEYEGIAAASMACFAQPQPGLHDRVFAVLDNGSDSQRKGITRALQLTDNPQLDDRLVRDLADSALDARGAAERLAALSTRGVEPHAWLRQYLTCEDPVIARAAVALVRFCNDRSMYALLDPLAQAADPELRLATIETALYLGIPGASRLAYHWAFTPCESELGKAARVWCACLGDPGTHACLLALVDDPEQRFDALWAIGFAGRIDAVDRCIPLLADEQCGPLAGEVVCAITGMPSDADELWCQRGVASEDDGDDLPPLADDLERDLVPAPETSLPIPQPDAILAWWQAHRDEFDPSLRYLGGRPLDRDVLVASLRHAPMRRRHVLAFELGVRSRGTFVDTRAMCSTQNHQLQVLSRLGRFDCQGAWPHG